MSNALTNLKNILGFILLVAAAVVISWRLYRLTAPENWLKYHTYTDPETGCQYLKTSGGVLGGESMTPRLDRDGKQICQ